MALAANALHRTVGLLAILLWGLPVAKAGAQAPDSVSITVIERAQVDTLAPPADSLLYIVGRDTATARRDSLWPQPKVALRRSLMFPGLGQVYNRSYWKLSIVYGALGTTVGFALLNHSRYAAANRAYQATTSPDNTAGDANLRAERDYYRRNRDLFFILTALGYALTAVESYVDAHLKHFDVSENLSLRVGPALQPTWARVPPAGGGTLGVAPSFSLRLQLR